MKKMYLIIAAITIGFAVNAQQTAKKNTRSNRTKSTTSKTAVKSTAKVEMAPAVVVDSHDGHNHGATAPVVDMAKPLGEDNLNLVETVYDFGKIPQGKPVTHDFKISNKGKTELKLDNVQASCGCTTPKWQPGPYKAGENADINVGFNAGAAGPFEKTVTITYNGGLTKALVIKGEVFAAPATPAPENKSQQILKEN
jgi:Protein of unknown function (DUF1573)